jgi:hypothetical protein
MSSKTKRQLKQEQNRRRKMTTNLIWVGIGAVAVGVIALVIMQISRPGTPAAGEAVTVMAQTGHVPTDSDPGQFNSDPPTSGPHYSGELEAGFYESNDYEYPAGYLVHNLEHGYIIFWYNCDLLDEDGCTALKDQIRTTMDDLGGTKMIAYPWPSIDVPLVLTSWGRMQKFESFDAEQAKAYYRANLNKAPEPNAP